MILRGLHFILATSLAMISSKWCHSFQINRYYTYNEFLNKIKAGMVRNPETQNPDRPKSRNSKSRNPKSRQVQNPDRVKIPTSQNPDRVKIPTSQNPDRSKSRHITGGKISIYLCDAISFIFVYS